MTLHLKSRGYPFRPRVLFSSFIVVGVGFPNCVLFQERTDLQFSTGLSRTARKKKRCSLTELRKKVVSTAPYNYPTYVSQSVSPGRQPVRYKPPRGGSIHLAYHLDLRS